MGGNAFSARGLRTPRMPPAVYHHMVHTSQAALRKLFRVVCTPVDGPAKPDFGDVDILVADPLEHTPSAGEVAAGHGEANPSSEDEGIPTVWDRITNALGAEHTIVKPHDSSAHFALPWPSHVDGSGGNGDEPQEEQTKFVQVDVRACESEKVLRWVAFRHAHGDIWNILGTLIRPLGLTADETALWLRIPEIEDLHRKRARVLLTDDPHVALDLLGLSDDKGQWDRPFDSYEDLFNYVATCRFFCVSPRPSGSAADGDARDGPEQLKLLQQLDAHGDAQKPIRAGDRRRMNTRPLFRAWVDYFIPRSRAAGLHPPPSPPPPPPLDDASTAASTATKEGQRNAVRDECFARFPAAALEYDQRLAAWRKERHRLALVEAIKAAVPAEDCERLPGYNTGRGCSRSVIVAALRKIVMGEDGDAGGESARFLAGFVPRRTDDGLWLVEDAAAFATARWRDMAPIAWEASQRRIAEAKRLKDLKRKAQEASAASSDDAPQQDVGEEEPLSKKQATP